MTISTVSGSSMSFVMASEDASSTGGMWFSVWMWDGMAGDAGTCTVVSWTSRSNICEPAGDAIRGEDEYRLRCGDEGDRYGWFARFGDIGVAGCTLWATGCAIGTSAEAAVPLRGDSPSFVPFDFSRSFLFLPNPNILLFPAFAPTVDSPPSASTSLLSLPADLGS